MPSRITQRQLAERLGLAQSTVSMALKNHPHLARETCLQIQELARKEGYHPDPYLSGLAAYRKLNGVQSYKATLAWVVPPVDLPNPCGPTFVDRLRAGAEQRGTELGYRIEDHPLKLGDSRQGSLARQLEGRGIEGLLLPPMPVPNTFFDDFDFSDFVAVRLTFSIKNPQLHVVAHQHFRGAYVAMNRLRALGYRRIGLALDLSADERTGHHWMGGAFAAQQEWPEAERMPFLSRHGLRPDDIAGWVRSQGLDAVITEGDHYFPALIEAGIAIPEELGFVSLSTTDDPPYITGIDQGGERLGSCGMEVLVDMLNRREFGVPAHSRQTLVEGTWLAGRTAPARRLGDALPNFAI